MKLILFLSLWLMSAAISAEVFPPAITITASGLGVPFTGSTRHQVTTPCCYSFLKGQTFFRTRATKFPNGITGTLELSLTGQVIDNLSGYKCIFDGAPRLIALENAVMTTLTNCIAGEGTDVGLGGFYDFVIDSRLTGKFEATNSTEKDIIIDLDAIYFSVDFITSQTAMAYHIVGGQVNVPAAATCTISLPSTVAVPPITTGALSRLAPGVAVGETYTLSISASCNKTESPKLTLRTDKPDNSCIGTDLSGYAVCLDGLPLIGGSAEYVAVDGSANLQIRGGRGTGSVSPGMGTGMMTVTASPL